MELGPLIQMLKEIEKQHGPTLKVLYHDLSDYDSDGRARFADIDSLGASNYRGEIVVKLI